MINFLLWISKHLEESWTKWEWNISITVEENWYWLKLVAFHNNRGRRCWSLSNEICISLASDLHIEAILKAWPMSISSRAHHNSISDAFSRHWVFLNKILTYPLQNFKILLDFRVMGQILRCRKRGWLILLIWEVKGGACVTWPIAALDQKMLPCDWLLYQQFSSRHSWRCCWDF